MLSNYLIMSIALVVATFVLGWYGRQIHGGQILKELTGYRPLAYSMYIIPMLAAFFVGVDGWYILNDTTAGIRDTIREATPDMLNWIWAYSPASDQAFLSAVVVALIFYPHTGPNHGHMMDMGRVAGTLKGDFTAMIWRFTIPNAAAAVVLGTYAINGAWAWLLLLVACIPAVTYAVNWKVWEKLTANGEEWPPTEWSERIYGGCYQAAAVAVILWCLKV